MIQILQALFLLFPINRHLLVPFCRWGNGKKLKQEAELAAESRSFWIQTLHFSLWCLSYFLARASASALLVPPTTFLPSPTSSPGVGGGGGTGAGVGRIDVVSWRCFLTSSHYKKTPQAPFTQQINSLNTNLWVTPKCVTHKIIQLLACCAYKQRKWKKYWYCRIKDRYKENLKSCDNSLQHTELSLKRKWNNPKT